VLRCRGDGRTYKFTVRVDDGFDGVQYQARFAPPAGEWTEVRLPIEDFVASFRGRRVEGAASLAPAKVRRIGLMISKAGGRFELLVDWDRRRLEPGLRLHDELHVVDSRHRRRAENARSMWMTLPKAERLDPSRRPKPTSRSSPSLVAPVTSVPRCGPCRRTLRRHVGTAGTDTTWCNNAPRASAAQATCRPGNAAIAAQARIATQQQLLIGIERLADRAFNVAKNFVFVEVRA